MTTDGHDRAGPTADPRVHQFPGAAALSSLLGAGIEDASRAQTQIDIAMARFTRVVGPNGLKQTLAEVERRAAFMGTANAYDSVYDDIVTGRWQLP